LVLERVSNAWTSQRVDQAERFADEHEETVDVGAVGALGVRAAVMQPEIDELLVR